MTYRQNTHSCDPLTDQLHNQNLGSISCSRTLKNKHTREVDCDVGNSIRLARTLLEFGLIYRVVQNTFTFFDAIFLLHPNICQTSNTPKRYWVKYLSWKRHWCRPCCSYLKNVMKNDLCPRVNKWTLDSNNIILA